MKKQHKIFIGCPTHDGRIHYRTAQALYDQASRHHQLFISVTQTSLINWNCNQLWCQALNMMAQHKFRYFAMLHSDVAPSAMWLDELVDIAEERDAAMLSACIAIKDEGGDISVGISNPFNDHWNHRRVGKDMLQHLPETFSMQDIVQKFPMVLESSKLLVNTGCCIVRLDNDWAHKLSFKGSDKIILNANSQFQAVVDPEDWNFSRQVGEHGAVLATTVVRCDHVGTKAYSIDLPESDE